jgi:hypothetical protein
MVSDKSTVHEFETSSVKIEITEWPFYPGEEIHLKAAPQGIPDYVSIHGNPKDKQTLTVKRDDSYTWIEAENLFNLLVEAIEKYKTSWNLIPEGIEKVEENED